MSSEATAPRKVCKVCQSDVAQLPRVKDAHGRYYCKPCYASASQSQAAVARPEPKVATPAKSKAAAPAKPKPAEPAKQVRKPATSAAREVPAASTDDFMGDFDANAEVVEAPVPGKAQPGRCPSCHVSLAPGAVICVACGANTKTGKKLKGASASGGASAVAAQAATALGNYAKGVIFGAIGAAIGAAIWCGIALATHYEIGYVAWALGGLTGFGMQLGYGDANPKAGLTAVGLALLGIAASKISIVYFFFKGAIPLGSLISAEFLKDVMEPMDLLFVALAVITAYRIGTNGLSFNED